jgi:hypothetical protein
MAFSFAYNTNADGASVVKDLPRASAYGTPNNFIKGDLVTLSSGQLVRATAATTSVAGVLEGWEFGGLVGTSFGGATETVAQASKTADVVGNSAYQYGLGKVRIGTAQVFRVPVKNGVTPAIGQTGGVSVDGTTGDQQYDSAATGKPLTVIDISKDGTVVFVKFNTVSI